MAFDKLLTRLEISRRVVLQSIEYTLTYQKNVQQWSH